MDAKIINSTKVLIPLPEGLKNKLQETAADTGVSMSAYIRRLIREDLSKQGINLTVTTKIV